MTESFTADFAPRKVLIFGLFGLLIFCIELAGKLYHHSQHMALQREKLEYRLKRIEIDRIRFGIEVHGETK